MKTVVMKFHNEELYYELIEQIKISLGKEKAVGKMNIEYENDEELVVNIIDRI